jgi:alcohol dehydrogenase (cytochrome c)
MKGFVVTGACALSLLAAPRGQPAPAGRAQYERLCARCHGADGHGGEFAPDIVAGVRRRSDPELSQLIRTGLPQKGMPGAAVTDAQLRALLPLLRTFTPVKSHEERTERAEMENGDTLEGRVLNRSTSELQLRSNDGQIHLLRRAGDRYRRVTSQTDWPTYHGQLGGNRFSALDEINRGTVARLSPRWMFSVPGASRLEVTPLVIDGVMYVTSVNECYALDAGSGRRLWHYERPRTKGVVMWW